VRRARTSFAPSRRFFVRAVEPETTTPTFVACSATIDRPVEANVAAARTVFACAATIERRTDGNVASSESFLAPCEVPLPPRALG